MTINIYIIRVLVAFGFGVSLLFSLAALINIIDIKPDKDNVLNIFFYIFLGLFLVSAYLLWVIK